jgi:hypothetical protein
VRSYEGNVHTIPSCCAFSSNASLPFRGDESMVLQEFKAFLESIESPLNKEPLFCFNEKTMFTNVGKAFKLKIKLKSV